MQCPTREELADCLLGRVPPSRADVLLDHAEDCEQCCKLLDRLDSESDLITQSLGHVEGPLSNVVSDACVRMIDRAEIYMGSHASMTSSASDGNESHDLEVTKKHLLQGTKVRDYEIIRPIGEGGMGAVFLARHSRLERQVALKVLSLSRSGDREAQRRFEQEMTIVGKLQHPGIVRALDAGEHDGVQYLVMELVEGADLRQLVDTLGPIPLADACEICRRAAIALGYAHEQNLIHRDVKPSNIMLEKTGGVKVMDLGLARFTDQHRSLTSTQQAMGSLDFMAPEQLQAAEVDGRADIYGLGCTLHFLLLGEPPEKRRTAALMVARTPKLETLKSILPPPITRLLQQMLSVDLNKRCESFAEVAEQLAPFCNRADLAQLAAKTTVLSGDHGEQQVGSITSEVERPQDESTQTQRRRLRYASLAAATTFILACASWFYFGASTANSSIFGERSFGFLRRGIVGPIEITTQPFDSSNLAPTDEIPLFQIQTGTITDVAFNPRTSQLICGSSDTSITVRDLPNQSRIVSVCLFDSPVKRLLVIPTNDQCICLDEKGNVACLQLPEAKTLWSAALETGTQAADTDWPIAEDLRVTTDAVEVVDAKSISLARFSLKDGSKLSAEDDVGSPISWPFSSIRTQTPVRSPIRSVAFDELFVRGETPLGQSLTEPQQGYIIDGNLARFVDADKLRDDDADRHFVYAEHAAPISCSLLLEKESLVFTGDTSGEIRLWHLPQPQPSYMLLSCVSKLNSIELTILHQQERWAHSQFANSPEKVKFDNLLGEMRIETEIERNGMRHVLEYRVKPAPPTRRTKSLTQ